MNRPNIILLTIDTLRADRLGSYGFRPSITPNLDRLAQKGVRFNQAITGGSWTQAAFPVMLTSTAASMYGGCLGVLAAERPSSIEALAQQGYRTGGFSTSPLLSRSYGYDRGFQYFSDLSPGETDPSLRNMKGGQRLLRNSFTHHVSGALGLQTRPAKLYATAAELTDKACHWMGETGAPFFAWIHYMDVHWPYHLEEELRQPDEIAQAWRDLAHLHDVNWNGANITPDQRDHYIQLYERAVAYTDAQVGKLLAYLESNGLADNTIVIVVADHGEEFMEHGRWGHWENNLYDEILKIPFIIHLPTHGGSQVVERQVRLLDLMPTVLDLCDCPAPSGVEGVSLVPLWTGGKASHDPAVSISEMWRDEWHIIAVRTEAFKYIWDSRQPQSPELFDLQADPGETQNVYTRYPEVVKNLHAYVEQQLQRMEQTRPDEATVGPDLDAEVLGRLRGLGYVE